MGPIPTCRVRIKRLPAVLSTVLALALGACGNKGPLYLVDENGVSVLEPTPADNPVEPEVQPAVVGASSLSEQQQQDRRARAGREPADPDAVDEDGAEDDDGEAAGPRR